MECDAYKKQYIFTNYIVVPQAKLDEFIASCFNYLNLLVVAIAGNAIPYAPFRIVGKAHST